MTLTLYSHLKKGKFSSEQIKHYTQCLEQALAHLLSYPEGPEPVLKSLDEIEINLVEDDTMAEVHWDFMQVEGTTDVITFHHGEIFVCPEEAHRQAPLHGESPERELFRYMIHGLVHLHGYLDDTPERREALFVPQEELVARYWQDLT